MWWMSKPAIDALLLMTFQPEAGRSPPRPDMEAIPPRKDDPSAADGGAWRGCGADCVPRAP